MPYRPLRPSERNPRLKPSFSSEWEKSEYENEQKTGRRFVFGKPSESGWGTMPELEKADAKRRLKDKIKAMIRDKKE